MSNEKNCVGYHSGITTQTIKVNELPYFRQSKAMQSAELIIFNLIELYEAPFLSPYKIGPKKATMV